MTDFNYINPLPVSSNNPSVDQPNMTINNASVLGILDVDHVGFNVSNGGTHLQVTFSSENTPGAQTDPQSVLYSAAGTASTVADLRYVNQNAIFQTIPIKAWGLFTGSSGAIIASQSVNIASIVRASAGRYTITMTTNAVTGTSFAILWSVPNLSIFTGGGGTVSYSITGGGIFTMTCNNINGTPTDPASVSFLVLQV